MSLSITRGITFINDGVIVSGVTMVKHMPRHEFGQVQTKLFPKYFTLGIITSVMGIVSFHHLNKEGFTDEQVFQVREDELLSVIFLSLSLSFHHNKNYRLNPFTYSPWTSLHTPHKHSAFFS